MDGELSALTRHTLRLPLLDPLSKVRAERAKRRARNEAERIHNVLRGDLIGEIWVGEIVGIELERFTAGFVFTIRDGDTGLERFPLSIVPEQGRGRIGRTDRRGKRSAAAPVRRRPLGDRNKHQRRARPRRPGDAEWTVSCDGHCFEHER